MPARSSAASEQYTLTLNAGKKQLFHLILFGENYSGESLQFPHLVWKSAVMDMGTVVVKTEHRFEKKYAACLAKKTTFPGIISNRTHVDVCQEVHEHLHSVGFSGHVEAATPAVGFC